MARSLDQNMKSFCEHCGALITGNVYRVTSEEEGIILLDMTVCWYCFVEAKRLHLHTEEIKVRSKQNFSSTPKESPFVTRNLISALKAETDSRSFSGGASPIGGRSWADIDWLTF
jgi:hypothetical protein